MVLGIREVVHKESVLGTIVAAGVAVAAHCACELLNSLLIHAIEEGHVDIREADAASILLRRFL